MCNMSIKMVGVVGILLCSIQWAVGQTVVLEGQIRNAKDEAAVPMANVIVESQDGGWLGYTTADAGGKYRVSWSAATDTVWVVVHALGYAKARLPYVLPKATASPFLLDIALRESSYDLNEVVVREDPLPVIRHSDTTTFQVAAFADSTESSVEELLKKLPGMQVDEQGNIRYNGKPISKVLIEGDDMFGGNYALGTRNIRATAIEKVDVIDHYLENSLLKDVVYSDDMVLNLTIAKEQKRILSGTVSPSIGYGEEFKAKESVSLFSFTKTSKALLFGNWNNVGLNAIGEVNAIGGNPLNKSLDLEKQIKSPGALLSLPQVNTLGLEEHLVNNARRGLTHLSHVVKFREDFKIKYMGTYYDIRNAQRRTSQHVYFNTIDTLAIGETENYSGRYRFGAIGATIDYRPTNRPISHKVVTRFDLPEQVATVNTHRTEGSRIDSLPLTYYERPINSFLGWEYTYRMPSKTVIQVIADYAYTYNTQRMTARWLPYAAWSGLLVDSLRQAIDLPQHEARALLRYLKGKRRYLLRIEMGATANIRTLKTRADFFASERLPAIDTTILQGRLRVQTLSPFLRLDYTHNISSKTRLNASLYTEYAMGRYSSMPASGTYVAPMVSPSVQLRHVLGTWTDVSLNYALRTGLPDFQTLYPSSYFASYQNLKQGLLSFDPLYDHSLSGLIRYNNAVTLVTAYLVAGINHRPNAISNRFSFETVVFQNEIWRPVPQSSFFVKTYANYLFAPLKIGFNVEYQYTHGLGRNIVNSLLQDQTFRQHQIKFQVGTAFDTWVNFKLSADLQYQTTINASTEGTRTIHTRVFKPKAQLSIRPTRQLVFWFVGYAIYSRNADRNPNLIYATDCKASYYFRGRLQGHSLSLRLANVLNQATYDLYGITPFSEQRDDIQAIPRFLHFEWSIPLQ